MAAKFGTSGLRGLVGDLTDGTAAAHARAFARHLRQTGMAASGAPIFLGQDMRASSPEIAAQCAAALLAEDLHPVDCGVTPTPALALHAMSQGAAALMVTGSHIPDDRNGVKFYRPDGEIDKDDEAAISRLASELAGPLPAAGALDTDSGAATHGFIARYRGFIPEGAFEGLRVGVYEQSSAAREVLATVLEQAGATVVRLGRSETFIPVDTEAVSEETHRLAASWVKSERLDALVSADGDGDRPLLVDETGTVLRGDALGLIVARYLDADAVITPVTSNSGIEQRCRAEVHRTKVGSPYVIAAMAEAQRGGKARVIGFEANGGVLTGNRIRTGAADLAPLPTRDSVLPLLCALAAARAAGQSVSAHVAQFELPVAISDRIENFPTDVSQALVARLSGDEQACAAFFAALGPVADIDRTDGLRITLQNGDIVHLRPSGNAPEMRIYSEATSETRARALIAQVRQQVRNSTGG
ncbi:phosphomannomutase [Hoeflea sp. G2-23]|uniref:Phosphomannomutase n=1 Tax=Hoeflea algicola TaxID=2983763 RepID=A0ABT3ZDQ0_9HYPH|nr:phosphomannomutase [Hoeflea algicola]MCY0149361.1 phosphomannomutase [Hoeflea algicola]